METIRERQELDRLKLSEWVQSMQQQYGTYAKFVAAIAAANPGEKIVSDETVRLWRKQMSASLTEDSLRQLARFRGETVQETHKWLYGSGGITPTAGRPCTSPSEIRAALAGAISVDEVAAILNREVLPLLQYGLKCLSDLKQVQPQAIDVGECIRNAIAEKGLSLNAGLRDFVGHLSRDSDMSSARIEERTRGYPRLL